MLVSLMVCVPAVEVQAETVESITEDVAYERLMALKEKYPKGKYWNRGGVTNKPCDHWDGVYKCNEHIGMATYVFAGKKAIQCFGFASMLNDEVFGEDAPISVHKSYDRLKVGDNVRLTSATHSFVVVSKTDTYITVAECNADYRSCVINWGRKITKTQLEKESRVYLTRYPDAESDGTVAVAENKKSVTLRAGKSSTSKAVKTCSSGTRLNIINSSDDWYYVQTIGGYKGYVHRDDLKIIHARTDLKLATPDISVTSVSSTGKIKVTWDSVKGTDHYEVWRASSKNGEFELMLTTGKTSYTNTSAVAGKTYYYKVRAVHSKEQFSSEFSTVKYRTCDLAAPAVKMTSRYATGKPKLYWSKIEGAKGYEIYRATSSSGSYSKLDTVENSSYIDDSAKTGKLYYYKVRAIHEVSAATSAYSSVLSKRCDLPAPVIKVQSVSSSGKIKISWDKVSGAEKYYVYRATSEKGEYEKIKTTSSLYYTDTGAKAGKLYYYKVKAVHDNSAANSAYSDIKSRRCDLARPVVTAGIKNGKPRLTWKKVSGAVEYKIYRSTSKDGEYKEMFTTTGTSYTNTSAKAGETYYYKVMAIHKNAYANSAYSAVVYKKAVA